MKFRVDNKYKYGQDHFQCVGIPAGVEFDVEYFSNKMFRLTSPGYGGKPYGNGQLYVWGLTKRQWGVFAKHAVSPGPHR